MTETLPASPNLSGVINDTVYTLRPSDVGRTLTFVNPAANTLYVPFNVWMKDFSVFVIQDTSAGTVTVSGADSTVSIANRQSHTGTAGGNAGMGVVANMATVGKFNLVGDTA